MRYNPAGNAHLLQASVARKLGYVGRAVKIMVSLWVRVDLWGRVVLETPNGDHSFDNLPDVCQRQEDIGSLWRVVTGEACLGLLAPALKNLFCHPGLRKGGGCNNK